MAAVDVVRDLYEAFGAKDEERLRSLLHPDVEWNQCPGFPGGARRRGAEQVIQGVLRGNNDTWSGFQVAVDEYLDCGDRVVVLGAYRGTHSGTGMAMEAVFAHVYRVEDGQVVRFEQIADATIKPALRQLMQRLHRRGYPTRLREMHRHHLRFEFTLETSRIIRCTLEIALREEGRVEFVFLRDLQPLSEELILLDDLEAELLAWCEQRLARYKCPRSVDVVDQLPRQDTGKLYKRLLRDRYWGDRGDHDSRIV